MKNYITALTEEFEFELKRLEKVDREGAWIVHKSIRNIVLDIAGEIEKTRKKEQS